MSEKWIVSIDQGTSSCRAFAVDNAGKVRAQKSRIFSPQRPQKGLSFYDGNELLATQLEVLHALLEEIGPEKVAALAICSQRSTVVLWDKNTGRPLAPVLTWEDGRSLQEAQEAPLSQQEVHAQTGLFKTPFFSASKILWCIRNYPSVEEALSQGILLVGSVASYLIWHLTQGHTFAIDPTLAQRTLLWNIQSRGWSETLCAAFKIPLQCLPTVRPSASDYGTYTYKNYNLPIVVCVADQQAAAAYHGLEKGQTSVNYGTGAFVLHHTGKQLLVLPGMLSSVTATHDLNAQQFLLEGPIFSAGSLLVWLKTTGIVVKDDQIDALAQSAKSPVMLLPALGGLGAPYWDYRVRVQTENVTSQTSPADWVAGALRAIASRVADIIYYLRQQHIEVAGIKAAGGLSNSSYLLQEQANLLGIPVSTYAEAESTVLGAARLAAQYLSWNTALWNDTPTGKEITPQYSFQSAQANYQAWQQFVQRCRQ